MNAPAAEATARGTERSAVERSRPRAWFERELRLLRDASMAYRLTTVLLLALVVAGVVLRVIRIADPAFFTFDEEMFVTNANKYLVHAADVNDHPPLGKLFMAVGILLFGYDSLGWRYASLCFGIQSIAIAYWLGKSLFGTRRAGLIAAAFLAGDGFFIAYSRCGLLDGMLTCLVLWTMLWAVQARRIRDVLVTVVLCGMAMSIKWSGAFAAVPAAAALLVFRRVPRWSIAVFALVPVVHAAIWTAGLAITGQPADPLSLWHLAKGLFWHHVELGTHDNGLASPWYSWIYLYHPIVVKLSTHGVGQRYASSAGNVLLWASGSLLVIGIPLVAGFRALRERTRSGGFEHFVPFLLLSLGWFALLSPWMVGRGKYTFSYHYLPSYGFAVLVVAGAVAWLEARRERAALVFVALVTAVTAFFAPVWSESTLPDAAADRRLIFVPWRP